MVEKDLAFVSRRGSVIATVDDAGTKLLRKGSGTPLQVAARGGQPENSTDSAPALKQNTDPDNVVYKSRGKKQYVVSPWGEDNLFPDTLIDIVYGNNLLPGLTEFKEDMMYGQGLRFVDSQGNEAKDPALLEWLDSWDYDAWIQSQIADYVVTYNCFGQFIKTRDGKRISHIEHVPAEECRCTVMKQNRVEHIIVADWQYKEQDFVAYPVFDPRKPLQQQADITMYHAFRKSTGYKYYGMPRYVGALQYWIPLLNRIPEYHLSMIRNSLNALFHVEIPYDPLEKMRQSRGWTQEQLSQWIDRKVNELEDMLAGSSNAGKTFYSFATKDPNSNTLFSWKITPIDNKAKQLSEGYLKLFNDGNQAITSAMQVQPSLACIQLGDKLSSGSEVLTAYNRHMQPRTQVPRKVVLAAMNTVLKVNFPGLDVRAEFDNVLLVHQDKDKTGVDAGNGLDDGQAGGFARTNQKGGEE